MPEALQQFKAELFKALAHPTRIRILELLGDGERSVGELQVALASEGSAVSQHLAILRLRNLVATRRVANSIIYRLSDPRVNELLDLAREMFDAHLVGLRSMVGETIPADRGPVTPPRHARDRVTAPAR